MKLNNNALKSSLHMLAVDWSSITRQDSTNWRHSCCRLRALLCIQPLNLRNSIGGWTNNSSCTEIHFVTICVRQFKVTGRTSKIRHILQTFKSGSIYCHPNWNLKSYYYGSNQELSTSLHSILPMSKMSAVGFYLATDEVHCIMFAV